MNPAYLVIGILIVIVVIGTALAFFINTQAEKKKRMMSVVKGKAAAEGPKKTEMDIQNERRADLAKKLKDEKNEGDDDKKKKKNTTISDLIAQAGLSISTMQFWIGSVFCCAICLFLAFILKQGPFVIGMAAIIGFFGLPRHMLKSLAKKRQKEFLSDFADALEATVRLLKAGMPVAEAIAMISKEFTGPLGEEMGRIYDKQKIGIPLHEAALEATHRMPLSEMNMFATGMAIQAQTGSSLSEVLMNLAGVIRARFKLKRKVKALASEAVASAGIIGALPLIVAGGMWFVNRDYINILFTDPFGKVLLTIAIGMMGTGIFVMKAMINFKV